MTDIASANESFFNSIIGNTTERTTAKLITFYKMHSGLGLLISKGWFLCSNSKMIAVV